MKCFCFAFKVQILPEIHCSCLQKFIYFQFQFRSEETKWLLPSSPLYSILKSDLDFSSISINVVRTIVEVFQFSSILQVNTLIQWWLNIITKSVSMEQCVYYASCSNLVTAEYKVLQHSTILSLQYIIWTLSKEQQRSPRSVSVSLSTNLFSIMFSHGSFDQEYAVV